MIDRTCKNCGVIFKVYPARLRQSPVDFCKKSCMVCYTANKNAQPLTIELLRECLHYDTCTGHFTWLKPAGAKSPKMTIGERAGSLGVNKKYRTIEFLNKPYAEHRLAWFYMTGEWPKDQVDHRDRDKLNNKWDNLREATGGQNQTNRNYLRTKNPYRGVSKKGKKWQASIGSPPKYLGWYDTPEEAYAVYCKHAKERYGEFFDPDRTT